MHHAISVACGFHASVHFCLRGLVLEMFVLLERFQPIRAELFTVNRFANMYVNICLHVFIVV